MTMPGFAATDLTSATVAAPGSFTAVGSDAPRTDRFAPAAR